MTNNIKRNYIALLKKETMTRIKNTIEEKKKKLKNEIIEVQF